MHNLTTYITEKLIINKKSINNQKVADIQYICVLPYDALYDYVKSNKYIDKFRIGSLLYILTVEWFIKLLNDNPDTADSKFWIVPPQYNDDLDSFISYCLNERNTDVLKEYRLSADQIETIRNNKNIGTLKDYDIDK